MESATTATASFFDGQTAQRHSVEIRPVGAGVEITGREGVVAVWRYGDLRVHDRFPDGRVQLGCDAGDARLIVEAATFDVLSRSAPALNGPAGRTIAGWIAAGAAAAAVLGAVLWFGWPILADTIAAAIPDRYFHSLGVAALESEVDGKRTCSAPGGATALQRLTDRLVAGRNLPARIEVRVVADSRVNAFAVPGGQVVVFRGLIDAAGSADEVAGVLAHEFSHVINRHPQRAIVRYAGLMMLGSALFGDSNIAALGPVLLTLSYSRVFEREADEYALDLLDAAGIDGGGLAEFFARLEKSRLGSGALARGLQYLSTHPPTDERVRSAEQHRRIGVPAMTAQEWQAVRAMCGA